MVTMHKYLYVGNYTEKNMDLFNPVRLFKSLEKYLGEKFDIINIDALDDTQSLVEYDVVIIDSLLFVATFGKIDNLEGQLAFLKPIKNKVMLFHDLHDYSLSVISNVSGAVDVILNNKNKVKLFDFFEQIGITHTISIYDCMEHDYYMSYFGDIIRKGYLLSHSYDPNIFKYRNNNKIYDVLIYGSMAPSVYPLRGKLCELCNNMNLRVKTCPTDYYYRETGPCEERLSDLINQSWLCISSVSIFSYFVRKYLEIPAAGSVILGNINDQGRLLIGHNLIEVNLSYSNELIRSIILYYLNNKPLLAHLCAKGIDLVSHYTYEQKAHQFGEICDSIRSEKDNMYEYGVINEKVKQVDKNTYDYRLLEIDVGDNFIQIDTAGDYCMTSDNLVTINEDISVFTTNDSGVVYTAFTIINAPCKLLLSGTGRVNVYKIIKCERFNTDLYEKHHEITSIHVASFLKKGFEQPILTRFTHLQPNVSSQVPCIYYGMRYEDELRKLRQNKELAVIIWTGGDIDINNPAESKNVSLLIKNMSQMRNVRYVVTSKFIQKDMEQLKLPYIFVPFMGIDLDKYQPCVKGDAIYIYMSHDGELYGKPLCDQIIAKYPQFKFLLYTNPAQYNLAVRTGRAQFYETNNIKCLSGPDEMADIYKQCFLGLRLTKHDGLSATVQELGCMGIKAIHNGNSPSAVNYQSLDDICQIIDEESKLIGTVDQELSQKVKTFLSIDNTFFRENYHYNNINYFFNHVYVLNLERSTDRKSQVLKEINKNNINNYEFYTAVDGSTEPQLSMWEEYSQIPFTEHEKKLGRKLIGSPGVLGNLLSIKNILLDAKTKGYDKILVLEDDVRFHKNFNLLFSEYARLLPDDWLLFLLGAGVNQIDQASKSINDKIFHCGRNLSGGFAMGIRHFIYDELIQECDKQTHPFDSGALHYVINKYNHYCYVCKPNLIICDVETSTMRPEKRNMNDFARRVGWELDEY
jgi:hypothetical protein